ncbi:DNA-directed RNA polymerase subunit RPB2 [uncultured virus]|nr:DNA-directed RNA polymerase subunit RPB2 [uncultured virus]
MSLPPVSDVLAALNQVHFSELARRLESIPAPELTISKESKLFRDILRKDGASNNVIEIFDHWLDNILPHQIAARTLTTPTGVIAFSNVEVEKPRIHIGGVEMDLTPLLARGRNATYNGPVYVTATLTPVMSAAAQLAQARGLSVKPENQPSVEKRILIGSIPIMLGSKRCHLYGKTIEEKLKMGECPNDPLGYYIIKGTEKSIIIQEKMRASMFFTINSDNKGRVESRVTCATITGTTIVTMAVGKKWATLKVKLQHMKQNHHIPLFVLFEFLGLNPSQAQAKILQYVQPANVRKVYFALQSSLAKAASIPDKVAYLARKRQLGDVKREAAATQIAEDIRRDLFSNITGTGDDLNAKADHLGLMSAHMLEAMLGLRILDNRDSWSNKRFQTGGKSMEQLFNGLWAKMIEDAQKKITDGKSKGRQTASIARLALSFAVITDDMETSFGSNSWGVKGSYTKENITDTLKRETPMAVYSQGGRINTPASRKAKQPSIRMLAPTQLGMGCSAETPEGEGCGLIKNTALTCYLSLDRSLDSFIAFIQREEARRFMADAKGGEFQYPLIVNGQLQRTGSEGATNIVWCDARLKSVLIQGRRTGLLPKDCCIFYNPVDRLIEYYCDGDRPTRPLLVVNADGALVMDEKKLWGQPLEVVMREGGVEYVDAREQEYIMLSQFPEDVRDRQVFRQRLQQLETIALSSKTPAFLEMLQQAATNMAGMTTVMQELIDRVIAAVKVNSTFPARDALTQAFRAYMHKYLFDVAMVAYTGQDATAETKNFLATARAQALQVLDGLVAADERRDSGAVVEPGSFAFIFADVLLGLQALSEAVIDDTVTTLRTQLKVLSDKVPYTHSEIDPIAQFGIAAGMIPQANSNQGPRATYQASMCKQALGMYHYNHHLRFDSTFKVLLSSSRPIFESEIAEPFGLNTMPTGATPIVAFYAMAGNNEDSIIVKQEYLEASNFELIKYVTHKSIEVQDREIIERFARPEVRRGESEGRYAAIDVNGLPRIGAYIRLGDCIIGKTRTVTATRKVENASLYAGIGEEGYVDRVRVTWNSKKQRVVKVKIRQRRKPIAGDKFASRYSQKGTIGRVVPASELPRIVGGPNDGLVPDFFINPHSIPSRMTMGMIKEMLSSKAALYTGERVDATTFHKFDIDHYRRQLQELGMDPDGRETMCRPNGKLIHNKIFVTPCYYQSLRHHVLDKIQMRATGSIKPMSHQPVGGRANEGGLRVGEMERDAIISHGATGILLERLMLVSDKYRAPICRTCGNFAIPNHSKRTTQCRVCGIRGVFGTLVFPYVFKLIIHMLLAMGITVNIKTRAAITPGGRPEERSLV